MADALLLLHAFPVDSWMWDPQVGALKDEAVVVAPDLPGFGSAPLAGPVMTMDAAADHAAGALDEAGVERAVICGLSMGGYVALAFWRRHRGRVSGFVFANTRAGADDEAGRERRRALAERLRSEGNAFLVEAPPPLLSGNAPADLWTEVREDIRRQPAEGIAAASLGMADRPDARDDLPGIDVPTLVIVSDGDTLIPSSATASMAGAVPGARLETIEGAGHLSNLEQPATFTRLLREHLIACGAAEGRIL
jgi:3-oxoadipate enol-lactonase